MRRHFEYELERVEHRKHWYKPSKNFQHAWFQTTPEMISFDGRHADGEFFNEITMCMLLNVRC